MTRELHQEAERDLALVLADLARQKQIEKARYLGRTPKKISDVVGQVFTRRGYGRIQTQHQLADAWKQVAAAYAGVTRVGKMRGGVLEVVVQSSVLVAELNFVRLELVARLREALPDQKIRSLRFRVGSLGSD